MSRALLTSPEESLNDTDLALLSSVGCCACADGNGGQSALAASAAKQWLASNAGAIKVFTCTFYFSETYTNIPTYVSLVSCMPALETVELCLPGSTTPNDLGCLLKGLSCLPSLRTLVLSDTDPVSDEADEDDEGDDLSSDATEADTSDFAKMRSLTKLALSFKWA